MKNALTIDLEDWYQTQDFNIDKSLWGQYESRIVSSTALILDLLEQYNTRATFFVLGTIAQGHSALIRKIADNGHEIGSHGFWHNMITRQTREEFRDDLEMSKKLLEDITGQEVKLFRAPTWSICAKNLWALEVLDELGFVCDSSIQPFSTPISGMPRTLPFAFHPIVEGRKLNLLEFPQTVLSCGKVKIPFSGGLYLRSLPISFVSKALHRVNKNNPGMIYIHPWELDVSQPRLPVPLHIRFTHYYNLGSTELKLKVLLQEFNFAPLGEVIKDGTYDAFSLH